MRRSYAFLVDNTKVMSRSFQGHFKVKPAKNIDNTHFLSISSCLAGQSSIRDDWCWHILGRVSFQHTFLGNLEQYWYCEGQCPHVCPYSSRVNWTSKITIMQQRVASTLASIAKDWYIIGYGGWQWVRVCFTAWMPPKINVKLMSRSCKMSGLSVYG